MMLKYLILSFALSLAIPGQSMAQTQKEKVQCAAKTKKGTRCKNKSVKNTKYCQVHQGKLATKNAFFSSSDIKLCKAKTRAGSQCSRVAKTSGYCTQHYKMHQEGKIK